jgi:hypothetical protein
MKGIPHEFSYPHLLNAAFLLLFATQAFGQIPMPKYSEAWSNASHEIRMAYLEAYQSGVWDAVIIGTFHIQTKCPHSEQLNMMNQIKEQLFTTIDYDTIIKVITDLYRDPANTYISWAQMLRLAKQKLEGKDIKEYLNSIYR